MNEAPPSPGSRLRHWHLVGLTLLISTVLMLAVGEITVRLVDPQATMIPRSRFSSAYGLEFHPDRVIVNELAGQWRFDYTTNAQGHRGPVLPLSNRYERPNVVVLGDSFTFGYGVADGQEYPALLRQRLGSAYGVVNLGTGGWGLTQELRRFYELGRQYEPQVVVLQFTGNDPSDNLLYPVTTLQDGRFAFHDRDETQVISVVKRLLSDSMLQRSHLYALARAHLYYTMRGREIAATAVPVADHGTSAEEQVYIGLLDTFARDLASRGIRLMIVPVEDHLAAFPRIRAEMQSLQAQGLARFIDLDVLFKTADHERSPEGHWGPASHRSVADALAREIATPARAASASRSR